MVAEQFRKDFEKFNAQMGAYVSERNSILGLEPEDFLTRIPQSRFFGQKPSDIQKKEIQECQDELANLGGKEGPRIRLLKAEEMSFFDREIQQLNT